MARMREEARKNIQPGSLSDTDDEATDDALPTTPHRSRKRAQSTPRQTPKRARIAEVITEPTSSGDDNAARDDMQSPASRRGIMQALRRIHTVEQKMDNLAINDILDDMLSSKVKLIEDRFTSALQDLEAKHQSEIRELRDTHDAQAAIIKGVLEGLEAGAIDMGARIDNVLGIIPNIIS